MARKNLLQGLMESAAAATPPAPTGPAPENQASKPSADKAPSPAPASPNTAAPAGQAAPETKSAAPKSAPKPPRAQRGAIGAVSQSIAALKARALIDLDPDLIDDGGMADRLEVDAASHQELVASIRDYGQQVPVLVRPHPVAEGRYQIVYGRRRLMALRELGQTVKALVRDLDDREAVLAQGQENSARRDLTFIEKANFARQLRDAGYDRKVVCDALNTDKTLISRMLSVADRVPTEVIETIGAAPSFGRDRWIALADLIVERGWEVNAMCVLAAAPTSDKRAEALYHALTLPDRRRKEAEKAAAAAKDGPRALLAGSGRLLGEAKASKGKVVLTFHEKDAAGFEQWLVENMTEIHRNWIKTKGEE
ncbi:MAG: plasmid partitioning protein RepB [Pikeienuella sp.]